MNDDIYAFISRKSLEKFEEAKNTLNTQIIHYIKEQTNQTFLSLIEPKDQYDSVYIDDDWNFGYYMKDDPNEPIVGETGPSRGQHHILGISFLHSISGSTNSDIPIFFDTPLGRIDELHKQNIGENISSIFKGTQVILFLTGSEASNMIKYIYGKVGWKIENLKNTEAKLKVINKEEIKDFIEDAKKDEIFIHSEENIRG